MFKYIPSLEHDDFMLTLYNLHHEKTDLEMVKRSIAKLKEKIALNMGKEKEFSILLEEGLDIKVTSFLPIPQNTTGEIVAWIVSYNDDDFLSTSLRDMILIRVFSFLVLVVLVFFVYRLNEQKRVFKNLLKSYDDNVIFARTDINWKLTHVSKAFCEISGYSAEELIGQEFIIKKAILQKELEQIHEKLMMGNVWKGEILDRKKTGEVYWVSAEIEPVIENEKIVGFSVIRQDITDRKEIEIIQKEVIFTIGAIGESRSKETANHVKRVALYSKILAKHYGLENTEVEMIEQASPMHDIGKVAIPDSILTKPGKLDEQERTIIETHAFKGYSMLKHSNKKLLQTAAIIAYEHHEKWNGTGYPRGLKGSDIHIYGRITALADVFDALGTKRCYKEAWPDEEVFDFIKNQRGKHFDPELVDIFFANLDEFLTIRKTLLD